CSSCWLGPGTGRGSMPRYAAVLRGVMPTNAKMPELKAAFEAAGFKDVRTLLGSGNLLFDAPRSSEAALERKAEAALATHLGRSFFRMVRSVESRRSLLAADPYTAFEVPAGWKRDVPFLRGNPKQPLELPLSFDGGRIYTMRDATVFSAHLPNHPK